MNTPLSDHYTAFDGPRRLATGSLETVTLAVQAAASQGAAGPLLMFDDRSGRTVDQDLRGDAQDLLARLAGQDRTDGQAAAAAASPAADAATDDSPRGRGRPRLGVVAREVTLLPRHWDWLNAQTGGASVALRKLVEAARRANADLDAQRQAQAAAYQVMSTLAGNLAGFEEASRALFANDLPRWQACMADWPREVRDYALRLAGVTATGAAD